MKKQDYCLVVVVDGVVSAHQAPNPVPLCVLDMSSGGDTCHRVILESEIGDRSGVLSLCESCLSSRTKYIVELVAQDVRPICQMCGTGEISEEEYP